MRSKEVDYLVEALQSALAGHDSPPLKDLPDVCDKIRAAGLLPELGSAAMEIVLRHNLAKLMARKAVLMASIQKPPLH
jgi:hypothetical protein